MKMKIKLLGLFVVIALCFLGCPGPEDEPVTKPGPTTPPKVTITFDMNGGSPNYQAVSVVKGSAFGLQYPPTPTKNNSIFGGWYADTDTSYSNEFIKTSIINDNITLKAKWSAECTITFNTDGGSAAPADIKIGAGSKMGDKYPPVPTKSGNTFDGWYAENDSTKYTKDTIINASIDLKAKWTTGEPPDNDKWTVTFNPDNDSSTTITKKVVQGAIIGDQYPTPDPTKEDNVFSGWYNGDIRYDKNSVINSDITLTAKWVSSAVQVNSWNGFSMASGTNGAVYDSKNGKENVLLVKPSSTKYDWNVIAYSLSSYVNKQITITLSMDVWVDTKAKIAWQINNSPKGNWDNEYQIVAGDNATGSEIDAKTWVHIDNISTPVTGTPASGQMIYLSGGQLENNTPVYITNFKMTITDSTTPVTPTDPDEILLTVGAKKDLSTLLGASMSGKTITWSSSNASKVTVNENGIITSPITNFDSNDKGSQKYTAGPARAEVTITATATDNSGTQTFTVVATTQAQEDIMVLSPFKDNFPSNILVGNIATPSDVGATSIINATLKRHFNALTPENEMKPSSLSSAKGSYNWTNADKFVNAAINSGFKVIGHTLLWHSQIPAWQQNMATAGRDTALAAMKQYITDVMTHFKGRIYSWDVLNEAFPDSGISTSSDWKSVIRSGKPNDYGTNPWYKAIGSDFVYEAYLAARLADPDAILYYNDYNTNDNARMTMIRNMVRDVNARFKAEYPNQTRLLIEGIGMQEHHNTDVQASSVRSALTMFKELGVKVSVSEIDVLGQGWNAFNSVGDGANKQGQSTVTNNGLLLQATRYSEYMGVYMEFKDIIERISIWGVTDNLSWRSAGLPLLFDSSGKAKPAYYKFVGAITK